MFYDRLARFSAAFLFCMVAVFLPACFATHPATGDGGADGSGAGEGTALMSGEAAASPESPPEESAEQARLKEARRHFTRGLMSINHGKLGDAEEHFLKTVELNPDSISARLYLARVYEKKNDRLMAIKQYVAASEIKETDPRPYFGLMDSYLDMGVPYRAAEVGEEALAKGVPPKGITNTIGWAYYSMGELDKAEAMLLRAREDSKEDTAPINNLGLVYFAKGDYEAAAKLFEEAGRLNPRSTLVPYFKAVTYDKLGDEDKVLDALAEGVEKDPKLREKVVVYNIKFFPHSPPGDLSAAFEKLEGAE